MQSCLHTIADPSNTVTNDDVVINPSDELSNAQIEPNRLDPYSSPFIPRAGPSIEKGKGRGKNKTKPALSTSSDGIYLEFARVEVNTKRAKLKDREKEVKDLEFQNSILLENLSVSEKAEKQLIYDRYFPKPSSLPTQPCSDPPPARIPACQSTCCRSRHYCCEPQPRCTGHDQLSSPQNDVLDAIRKSIEELRDDIIMVKSKLTAVEVAASDSKSKAQPASEDILFVTRNTTTGSVTEVPLEEGTDDSIKCIRPFCRGVFKLLCSDNLVATTEALKYKMFSALTWNCESLKSSIFELSNILSASKPTLVFLSEPQLFQCDSAQVFQYVDGEYGWHLNSADLHDPELPIMQSRAHGGTAVLWKRDLDPFIEIIPTNTTAFLPVALSMPGLRTSIHISIYLPTHGKDSEFVSDLAEMRNCLDELHNRFTDPVIYIRGDGNVNDNNKVRVSLLRQLVTDYKLTKTEIGHATYHHFVGNGIYDSRIDILLHSTSENVTESVSSILCTNDHPELLSHHDVILSNFAIPTEKQPMLTTELLCAPKL